MPQVYRRHSDYSPRPSLVPRRRSSMAPPGPGPQPTDADDSIVLADLVRTGEASRLRRRGAMRIDHPRAPATGVPASGPSSYAPPVRPIVIEPSRTPSPEPNAEPGVDEYTYNGGMWRDWDAGAAAAAAGRAQGRSAEGVQAVEILSQSTQAGQAFILCCGGEETVIVESAPARRFEPSLFPGSPAPSTSSPSWTTNKSIRRTNGCGALVHVRAYAQRPRGVWMAKEEAMETVVGLDSSYCDHPSMDKMLKSACGCIREGIGCAVWYVCFSIFMLVSAELRHSVVILSAHATCPARPHPRAYSRPVQVVRQPHPLQDLPDRSARAIGMHALRHNTAAHHAL